MSISLSPTPIHTLPTHLSATTNGHTSKRMSMSEIALQTPRSSSIPAPTMPRALSKVLTNLSESSKNLANFARESWHRRSNPANNIPSKAFRSEEKDVSSLNTSSIHIAATGPVATPQAAVAAPAGPANKSSVEATRVYKAIQEYNKESRSSLPVDVTSSDSSVKKITVEKKESKDPEHIAIYTVHIQENAKTPGRTYEVKEFKEGAHQGPGKAEFEGRADLVLKAATRAVDRLPSTSDNTKYLLNKAIDELHQKFKKDLAAIKTTKDSYTNYKDYEKELHHEAAKLTAQFTRDVQFLIQKKDKSFTMHSLITAERDYIRDNPRPTFINIFPAALYPATLYGEEKKIVSMQRPIGERGHYASTDRGGVGLVNYVDTAWGAVQGKGEDAHIAIDFEGIRHSSLPPIHIESTPTRQAVAMNNARQLVADCAAKTLASSATPAKEPVLGSSPDHPIKVSIDSMMLFTAKMGIIDNLRNRDKGIGKWKGESEKMQLEESLLALGVYDGRTLKMDVNGEERWVEVDIQAMNLGVNVAATKDDIKGHIPNASIQAKANAEGMVRYTNDTYAFLEKHIKQLDSSLTEDLLTALNEERTDLPGTDADARVLQSERQEIQAKRLANAEALDAKQAQIVELHKKNETIPEKVVHEFETLVKTQNNLKNAEYKLYQQEQKLQMKRFNQENNLQGLLNARAKENPNNPQLQLLADIHSKFRQSQQCFYSKRYEKADHVMEFPTLRLEVAHLKGRYAQFNCKSAEDRTGNVDNTIGVRAAIRRLLGRRPMPTVGDRQRMDQLAPTVHFGSTSLDNTAVTGAPGYQVGKAVNRALGDLTQIGKKFAGQAKGVFKAAKKLAPSETAVSK